MRALLERVLGLLLAGNGAFMLVLPESWYGLVPGVAETGPFNPHFVRDVGAAYLVAGASLLWFCWDRRARSAALAGAAFLGLHALIHLWDAAARRESLDQLLMDLPTVMLPGLLVLAIARRGWRNPMEDDHVEMVDKAAARRL